MEACVHSQPGASMSYIRKIERIYCTHEGREEILGSTVGPQATHQVVKEDMRCLGRKVSNIQQKLP